MIKQLSVILFCALFISCEGDDNDIDAEVVPPRTLSEVAVENDDSIRNFLETHTYNYEEFQNPTADFDFKVKLEEITGENADKIPLANFIQTQTISVTSENVGRSADEGEVVDHTLYYLEIEQGQGVSPEFADRVITNYEGSFLDGSLFDSRTIPTVQYLPFTLRGYSEGMQKLTGGTGFVENPDATVTFQNFGVGLVIMPSGLAYFDNPPPSVGSYVPLVFTISLLSAEANTDFDEDGIPSFLEDLDGDGNLNDDNTDQEIEAPFGIFLPNHNDPDDDEDGIPTIDEIELDNEGNFVGFKDSDGDRVFDHLDNDN